MSSPAFWNLVFQHQACESRVPFTFPHLPDGLPGMGQSSCHPACCLALNYSSLQSTPVAYPGLGGSGRQAHLGMVQLEALHAPSLH